MAIDILSRGYICRVPQVMVPKRIVLPLKLKIANKRQIKIFIKKCEG